MMTFFPTVLASSYPVALGCAALLTCSLFHHLQPVQAASPAIENKAIEPSGAASLALQRLQTMFSPDIQKTLTACQDQGKVDLSLGPDRDGSVICGDGSRESAVLFKDYVSTYSDVVAASGLIGLQAVLKDNPQVKPDAVFVLLNTPNGKTALRSQLRKIIVQTELVPKGSAKSANFLVDRVMERAAPHLKNARAFNQLLGSKEQYRRVVDNFCTPPGMALKQAQNLASGLSSVQLYAICIQESGLAEEIRQMSSR